MQKHRAEGIVFKAEDRLDADRIFSVFTKELGRLEVSGKAIRKINSKLRGGTELFAVCDIEFVQGRTKNTLTDAVVKKRYLDIAASPEKYMIARKICQVLDDFIKGQESDERIFHLVQDTFEKLNVQPPRQLMYYYFFWNCISLLGYGAKIKPWDAWVAQDISVKTQQSLQEATKKYYRYLLEHTR